MDIEKMKERYALSDGVLNYNKILSDLSVWLDFEEEYHINELGGIRRLRHILGDNDEFYQKYINEKKWWL